MAAAAAPRYEFDRVLVIASSAVPANRGDAVDGLEAGKRVTEAYAASGLAAPGMVRFLPDPCSDEVRRAVSGLTADADVRRVQVVVIGAVHAGRLLLASGTTITVVDMRALLAGIATVLDARGDDTGLAVSIDTDDAAAMLPAGAPGLLGLAACASGEAIAGHVLTTSLTTVLENPALCKSAMEVMERTLDLAWHDPMVVAGRVHPAEARSGRFGAAAAADDASKAVTEAAPWRVGKEVVKVGATELAKTAAAVATQSAAKAAAKAATKAAAKSAGATGIKAVAKEGVEEAIKLAAKEGAEEGAKKIIGAAMPVFVEAISLAVEVASDARELYNGRITSAEFGRRTVRNGSGSAGSYAGAAVGQVMCPIPGVGAFVGGVVGGLAARGIAAACQ